MNSQSPPALDRNRSDRQRSAATSAPINTDALMKRCMGSISFAHSLLSRLESGGNQQVEEIVRHAANDDAAAAAEVAHSLKGAAAIIGAESLSAKAAEIEAAGRNGEATALANLVRELEAEMTRCLAFIPTARIEAE